MESHNVLQVEEDFPLKPNFRKTKSLSSTAIDNSPVSLGQGSKSVFVGDNINLMIALNGPIV